MKFHFILAVFCLLGSSNQLMAATSRFQALRFSPVQSGSTWAILERDGASRQVEPYLSSLGWGETGTGEIISPELTIESDSIRFAVRGHDGPQNDSGLNYVALVEAASGTLLRQAFAPGSDAIQEMEWDVRELQGKSVRIVLHDGDRRTAYAWFGVEWIQQGDRLLADFRKGLPEGWTAPTTQIEVKTERLPGQVPFQRLTSVYSMCPPEKTAEIPCGFSADRLFLLGCTVPGGSPLDIPGYLEINYEDGSFDRLPLMVGFTLEAEDKLLSRARPMRLRPSSDPFQHILAVTPRPKKIEKIILEKAPRSQYVPRITAITALTSEDSENLLQLRIARIPARLNQWLKNSAVPARGPRNMALITERICARHRLPTPMIHFEKKKISDRTFEAASAFDVDLDGHMDLVSGGFWYPGPDYDTEVKITDVTPAGEYWEDFSDYPMDVNGDGKTDIVTGAFFGEPLRWLENPGGRQADWKVHKIADVGAIETTRFWDVDGDGYPEIAPNAGGNVVFYRLVRDEQGKGTGNFTRHEVKLGGCGHGLGFGDVNGDGRGDFIVPNAWLEAPEDPLTGPWTWHDDGFNLESASVPILVHDVNEDGKADLIVGQSHAYGLDWWEQTSQPTGERAWIRHPIEISSSQYHDLALADIDNDNRPELITGKRYRAHNGHDPGSRDPLVIRYFDIDSGAFHQHVIDYGPAETTSGLGIYFWIEDTNKDGWLDIVAPGKEGLYLFRNLGRTQS